MLCPTQTARSSEIKRGINPEKSSTTMTPTTSIDRKRTVVCETRRGGAEVQLPQAGTRRPAPALMGNAESGVYACILIRPSSPARPSAPGTLTSQRGAVRSARRAHAPEVAGSNPAAATPHAGKASGFDREIARIIGNVPLAGRGIIACVTRSAVTDAGLPDITVHAFTRAGFATARAEVRLLSWAAPSGALLIRTAGRPGSKVCQTHHIS